MKFCAIENEFLFLYQFRCNNVLFLTCLHKKIDYIQCKTKDPTCMLNSTLNSFDHFCRTPVDDRYEPFFHISIVEGDISLVLDSEALSR